MTIMGIFAGTLGCVSETTRLVRSSKNIPPEGNTMRSQATLRTFTGCDSQRWENNAIEKTGNDTASYTLRWERQCQMIER
jgi:hypothetical protein